MSARDDVQHIIDEWPEGALPDLLRHLERLRAAERDPFLAALMSAPLDDEPTTPEEDEGAAEAWQEHLRGESIPWEEFARTIPDE